MKLTVHENDHSPVHTFLRTWMPRTGSAHHRNAGEPPTEGDLKCGLSWEWLKWARDFYGISLPAAKMLGKDFLKNHGK